MSGSLTFNIGSEEELSNLCPELEKFATNSRIWVFSGEMGAGKTTFIKRLCKHFRVVDQVSSPTFSLVNEYFTETGERIYHFDFYRINSPNEAVDIGCEEYFYGGSLCFIEWAEKILNLLPRPYVRIRIEGSGQTRSITFTHER
ncbi:MAG: tRNA (adenosine(37)-N6)-threonylcarbamoyltransferase complex ATPase subunit type 1 TsaE [Bacteroidia bacterium]